MQDYFKQNIDINKSSGKSFALTFAIIFICIFIWSTLKTYVFIALASVTVAVLLVGIGFFRPHYMNSLNILWLMLGTVLGKIFSPLIMLAIYVGVVCPTGIILRMLRRDYLNIRHGQRAKSAWLSPSSTSVDFTKQY